jgi:RNA polymerase sigma factor (TIGR02999 family)
VDRTAETSQATELISAAKLGDAKAEEQLFALLYRELKHLAHSRLKRSQPCTLLETTALVHETYLRLHRAGYVRIADRSHFLAYAASAMRSIVVDFVRGAGRRDARATLSDLSSLGGGEREIIRVNEALDELAAVNDRLVKVVEMRYFAGMKESEIAETLAITERTVRRDWEKARMILAASLK